MGKKFLKDNSGFTLLELVIAIMVLAIIMTPMMRSFMIAARTSQSSVLYGEVTETAENAMEVVKSADISRMTSILEAYYPSATEISTNGTDTTGGVGTYTVKTGSEKIVIQVRETTDTDNFHQYQSADYAQFTDIDLSLIQLPGAAYDATSGRYVTRDPDVAAYEYFLQLTGSGSIVGENIKRQIKIYLEGSESNQPPYSDDETVSVGYIKYNVYYSYTYGTQKYEHLAFRGEVSTGTDGVVAMQMVYIPMANGTTAPEEEIIIYYGTPVLDAAGDPQEDTTSGLQLMDDSGHLPDEYGLRLFLIKQKRVICTFTCANYDKNEVVDELSSYCTSCKPYEIDESYYKCNVHLVEGHSNYTDSKLELHSNINLNVYKDEPISDSSRFKFCYYTKSSSSLLQTTMDLEEKLVVNTTGGRIHIVNVKVYDADDVLVSEMETVKLS